MAIISLRAARRGEPTKNNVAQMEKSALVPGGQVCEAERAFTCTQSERCGWNAEWAGAEGPAASSPPPLPLPPLWAGFSTETQTSKSCSSGEVISQHPLWLKQRPCSSSIYTSVSTALTFRVRVRRKEGKKRHIDIMQTNQPQARAKGRAIHTGQGSHTHSAALKGGDWS